MAAAPLRQGWRAALLAAAISLAAFVPDAAHAASRVCRQLEAELASGGGGTRSSGQLRKQDAAIAKQSEVLQRAKRQARGAGCGFKLFGGSANSCGAINDKIDRMERNLDGLQRKRAQLAAAAAPAARAPRSCRPCGQTAAVTIRSPNAASRRASTAPGTCSTSCSAAASASARSSEELGEPGFTREDRHVRRVPQDLEGGWVNDDGRIRYSAPPAATARSACAPATATFSRCPRPRRLPTSSATRPTASRAARVRRRRSTTRVPARNPEVDGVRNFRPALCRPVHGLPLQADRRADACGMHLRRGAQGPDRRTTASSPATRRHPPSSRNRRCPPRPPGRIPPPIRRRSPTSMAGSTPTP